MAIARASSNSSTTKAINPVLARITARTSAMDTATEGSATQQISLPLDGVRVLELGTMITAPYAAMLLAELGATVIKVENPESGDPFRATGGGRYGANFIAYNHGKRSLALDLKTPAGQQIFRKLLEQSDVLVENYRGGVMDKFGFGAEAIRVINPRLIHCSITGFGSDGPYRDRPAYDAVASALSGIYALAVEPDDPKLVGVTISDNVTGMYAANGVLGALYERERLHAGRLRLPDPKQREVWSLVAHRIVAMLRFCLCGQKASGHSFVGAEQILGKLPQSHRGAGACRR